MISSTEVLKTRLIQIEQSYDRQKDRRSGRWDFLDNCYRLLVKTYQKAKKNVKQKEDKYVRENKGTEAICTFITQQLKKQSWIQLEKNIVNAY